MQSCGKVSGFAARILGSSVESQINANSMVLVPRSIRIWVSRVLKRPQHEIGSYLGPYSSNDCCFRQPRMGGLMSLRIALALENTSLVPADLLAQTDKLPPDDV